MATMTDRHCLIPLIWLLLTVAVAPAARASASVPTPLSDSLERRLLTDAADGRFDQFSLVEASLIAGGASRRQTVAQFCRRFDRLVAQFEAESAGEDDLRRKADAALRFLHREVLKGPYRAELAELDRTLTDGVYNCLTATILYQALCHRVGVPVAAVSSPGHVLSRLDFEQPLEVETTCSEWFDIANDPQRRAAALARYGVGSTEGHGLREITPVQLAAKVYYNRAAALLARQHYGEAIAALRTSIQWDPADTAARENLLAGLNNWALALCDRGEFDRAAKLLEIVARREPAYPLIADNQWYVHRRWAAELQRQGRYEQARDMLRRWSPGGTGRYGMDAFWKNRTIGI